MAAYCRLQQKNGKPDIAVCILFFEKLTQTIECIKSFLSSGVNIYVLNNGSSSASRELLVRFCEPHKQIEIFDSTNNLGVSGGRNYLINNTTETWLFFVDNDIIMKTSNWLDRLAEHISINRDTEVFAPKMYVVHTKSYALPYSYSVTDKYAFTNHLIIDGQVNVFPGGASIVNRNIFVRLGMYDERIFIAHEDTELCLRGILSKSPVRTRIISDIEVVHDHRPAKKEVDKLAAKTRYDKNITNDSYNWIAEKHGITLIDSARLGTVYNLEHMTNKYNPASIYFWKQFIPRQLKKLLREVYMSKIQKRALPSAASLYMCDRCNFACTGCRRQHIGIDKSKDMTLATVQRLVSLYPSLNRFCLAGQGEPTLCADFVEIADYLKVIGKYVTIVTNGTNPDKILSLNHAPDNLSISLYGYNNDQYLSYVGLPYFDKVINSFLQLKRKYRNVGFSYIVNKDNYKNLEGVLSLCDEVKPDFVDLHNYLAYTPDNKTEISKIIKIQDVEIIKHIESVCNGRKYPVNTPVYINLDKPKFLCRSYNFVINLDGSGNIGGCQRQVTPNLIFGNIFTDNDPYNSENMAELRKRMFQKKLIHKECGFCFGNWREE
ncbi:MAG: hypothetical protein A2505_05615 [Deltaproteobacteria bacterium RIFOXYD12_FULL_55_16]|nr:MAG: hypothetical protein A2505_05615 [Deltaproteobacteria bacterium RIFOXYD12_FULL_55_16]